MVFEVFEGIFSSFGTHGGSFVGGHVGYRLYGIAHLVDILGLHLYATADTLCLTARLVNRLDYGFSCQHIINHLVGGSAVFVKETMDAAFVADIKLLHHIGYAGLIHRREEIEVVKAIALRQLYQLLFLRTTAHHDVCQITALFECVGRLDEDVHGCRLGMSSGKPNDGFTFLMKLGKKGCMLL